MGCARFLPGWLTGEVCSDILSEVHPTSPHTFEPLRRLTA